MPRSFQRDAKGRFVSKGGVGPKGKSGLTASLVSKDRGMLGLAEMVKGMAKAGRAALVGVQGEKGAEARDEGLTNAGLATIHEFGASNNRPPERSFLRSTFDENQQDYQKELDQIGKDFFDGKLSPPRVDGELLLLGEKYRGDIIEKIRSGIPPPLAESTIEEKGGEETPLIRTGQLWNSITAIVGEKPKGEG